MHELSSEAVAMDAIAKSVAGPNQPHPVPYRAIEDALLHGKGSALGAGLNRLHRLPRDVLDQRLHVLETDVFAKRPEPAPQ